VGGGRGGGGNHGLGGAPGRGLNHTCACEQRSEMCQMWAVTKGICSDVCASLSHWSDADFALMCRDSCFGKTLPVAGGL